MTKHARIVLEDCREALAELHEVEGLEWRRRWIATIALLKAIGEVCDKIDNKPLRDDIKQVIRTEWESKWKEEEIYRGFIAKERNNVLHTYMFFSDTSHSVAVHIRRLNAGPRPRSLTAKIGNDPLTEDDINKLKAADEERAFEEALNDEEANDGLPFAVYSYSMRAGPYSGEDPRIVVAQAIEWWEQYLDRIDELTSAHTQQ